MYEQTLIRTLEDRIPEKVIKRQNRYKKWDYGYNKEYDVVIISRTGMIDEIVEIQGLAIALPKAKDVYKRSGSKEEQYWEAEPVPAPLQKIKTTQQWELYPDEFKEEWVDYIESQFNYRDEGFWFKNNGRDTYITGSHWMYLTHSKTDVGQPDYRESNRIFYIFWEACKADPRCYGMCYLKNRRSGFSFMSSGEVVNLATLSRDSRYGILSKTAADAKIMFTEKVVPISLNYPFFFKPIQDGMDRPKTELAYRVPAKKLTRKDLKAGNFDPTELDSGDGINTSIDHKPTGDNSYDGEKLKLLIHDESGKWLKPNNIINNWRVTKTCLRLGRRIIGKCMMGSTSNALDKGGENYKKLYYQSDVTKRNRNGQTTSGLYSLFIPMEWNFEGFIDRYGMPVFDDPRPGFEPVGPDGEIIEYGVITHWDNEVEGLKDDPDGLNEFTRQYPKTEEHAFRDEAKNSLFNLTRLYEQIDYNGEAKYSNVITRGSFRWVDGIQDTRVEFYPNNNGRFYVSWIPDYDMQNNMIIKNGMKYPAMEHIGAGGLDSYDISGTVDGRGSNGAFHLLTKFNMDNAPSNQFIVEYIARPQTAEIFFEDILMSLVFYGMPVLAENNKPRFLYYLKRRGYRGYSMNRPDKTYNQLSTTERDIGGIPSAGGDMIQAHAAAIEAYVETHVGHLGDGQYGNMYFNRTLNDWIKYDITKRTKHDASISSGLAIMANQKHMYRPIGAREVKAIDLGIKRFNNSGLNSKII